MRLCALVNNKLPLRQDDQGSDRNRINRSAGLAHVRMDSFAVLAESAELVLQISGTALVMLVGGLIGLFDTLLMLTQKHRKWER